MKLLSKDKQNDMAVQMCNKARDIDICLFNALDETMPKELLLDCLMLYETKDGGYGHGLYIDNYNTNSSVYQVYEALRLLDLLGFDSNCDNELFEHIINKAFNYIYNREKMINNKWNPNVKTNDSFAHSDIFSYTEENFKLFGYHPTAAILGYTLVFCKETKAYYKKALRLIPIILDDFYKLDNLSKFEAISFGSLLNSLKKVNLFNEEWDKIEKKLIDNALNNISLDFNDTNLHPLEAAIYLNDDKLNEMKDKELDYLIDSIKSFGLWDHVGSWGSNKYPEEDSASLKWIGATTVQNYFYLKYSNRLEK